jgi:hypothetical protein
MKTLARRVFMTALLVAAMPSVTGTIAYAQFPPGADSKACVPGIAQAFQLHPAAYTAINNALQPQLSNLTTQLRQMINQATYEVLLTTARSIASSMANGRVLVTVPDGTVVLDTARTDDPNNMLPVGNSYQHYLTKTVNENHNSRVAILGAQLYRCGVGH